MQRLSLYLIVALVVVVSLFNVCTAATRYGLPPPSPFGPSAFGPKMFRKIQNENGPVTTVSRTVLKTEESDNRELFSNVLHQIKEAGRNGYHGNLKPSQVKNDGHQRKALARAKELVARLLAAYKRD